MKPRLERELYEPALKFLNLQPETKADRFRNNPIPNGKGGLIRLPTHELGAPDIIGVKKKVSGRLTYGQCFAFEFKRKGLNLKLREEQKRWMDDFARAGGVAYVVDTVQDVIDSFPEI